jgi:hypothetical protein
MAKTIYLKELLLVAVLFEGDFHELASFILRGYDARDKVAGTRTRPTVHGVAATYAWLFTTVDSRKIDALRVQLLQSGKCLPRDG